MEHFKTNRGKSGILYEGFRFRKDRDPKMEPEDRFSYNGAQIIAVGQGKAVNI